MSSTITLVIPWAEKESVGDTANDDRSRAFPVAV
jgi:hypothetical protein